MADPTPTAEPIWDKPRLSCPHCGRVLQLYLRCAGVTIVPTDANGNTAETQVREARQVRQGTEADQDVIAAARRAGLLEPFTHVVRYVRQEETPKDLDQFFVIFMRGCRRRLIPQYALDIFLTAFGRTCNLEYYSTQGIGAVLVNGYIRMFVPNAEIVGTKVRRLGSQNGRRELRVDDGEIKLREWIHTRWGYVAGPGAMLDTLHKRALGDFARPNIAAPSYGRL